MKDIIAMLPKSLSVYPKKKSCPNIGLLTTDERQSMLFSATQTTKVTDLARISLRPGPIHIDVDKEESTSTVSTLSQGYVVCPPEHRFLLLFTFLKKNLKKKVIVFFSSCNSVKYHSELFNYIDVPVLDLHVGFIVFLFFFRNSLIDIPFFIYRVNRNNKNEQIRSLNLSTRNQGFYSRQMLLREGLISLV